jgi:hypothetical protein
MAPLMDATATTDDLAPLTTRRLDLQRRAPGHRTRRMSRRR